MWDGSAPGLPAAILMGVLEFFERKRSSPPPTASQEDHANNDKRKIASHILDSYDSSKGLFDRGSMFSSSEMAGRDDGGERQGQCRR